MINIEEFTKRIKKIMAYYNESASSFAEKIGVQRSSISHILSGRNKPSLEFILKILSAFPDVELYWLLNGKGSFPIEPDNETINYPDNSLFKPNTILESEPSKTKKTDKQIERIVIFYSDGSFKNFEN